MEKEGHKCTSIEGSMELGARDRVVKEFRDGTTKILISTDVLSRGFDVTQVRQAAGRKGRGLANGSMITTLVTDCDVPVKHAQCSTPDY